MKDSSIPLALQRKQHVITVKMIVNNEPVPGALHDPQEMAQVAAKGAAYTLGSYDPIVINSEAQELDVEKLTDEETASILRSMTKEKV